MDRFKNLAKDGWHPEKKGTSWLGRSKETTSNSSSSSSAGSARPITSLRDPSSFAPPPRNVNAYGPGANNPSPTQSQPAQGFSRPSGSGAAPPPAVPAASRPGARQDFTGLASTGAPLPDHRSASQTSQEQGQAEEEKPILPFRVNTTGLEASNLPPPPRRLTDQSSGVRNASPVGGRPTGQVGPGLGTKQKPALPPRLPPREAQAGGYDPNPPPAYSPAIPSRPGQDQRGSTGLNQGAISRLGAAGVNVPGLGIGGSNQSTGGQTEEQQVLGRSTLEGRNIPSADASHGTGAMNELQARFARIGKGNDANEGDNTATTTENFGAVRQAAAKKPPPPPPPKKTGLGMGNGDQQQGDVGRDSDAGTGPPPPVPMGTKPR